MLPQCVDEPAAPTPRPFAIIKGTSEHLLNRRFCCCFCLLCCGVLIALLSLFIYLPYCDALSVEAFAHTTVRHYCQ